MTMGFKLPAARAPSGLRVGDRIDFEFRQAAGGSYEILRISPAAPAGGQGAAKRDASEARK
jgi:hypothetical protein